MKTILGFGIAVLCCATGWAQVDPGSWTPKTSSPTTCSHGALASDGNFLYRLGGSISPNKWAQRYSPMTDSWITLPPMPTGGYYFAAAFAGGRLYAFGNTLAGYDDEIQRFDVSTNTWTICATKLSVGRRFLSATKVGARIYLVGGYSAGGGAATDDSGSLDCVEEFDFADDSIRTVADLPDGRYSHGAAAVDAINRLYICGGFNEGAQSTLFEFTPPLNDAGVGSWTERAPIIVNYAPEARHYCTAFSLKNRVYLTGGYNSGTTYNTTLEYSPFTDSWAERDTLNTARYGHGSAMARGRGYVLGGVGAAATTFEQFTPPDFGLPPDPATGVTQSTQNGVISQGGWTNNAILFSASITDPDPGQLVRLEVRVKESAAAWSTALTTSSPNQGQGMVSVPLEIPSTWESCDWQFRVADANDNFTPVDSNGAPIWVDFNANTVSPDFHSDQELPGIPTPLDPVDRDVEVGGPTGGDIPFTWTVSNDNGPADAIRYSIQVSFKDMSFSTPVEATGLVSPTATFPLAVSTYPYYWRVGATDIGGNFSGWSAPAGFRVTHDDAIDHGAKDAVKACGFGATSAPAALVFLVIALLLLRRI